nr:hypothetical protein [Gammaproteobacteria bacterium]
MPVAGGDEVTQTNEIKIAIALLEAIDLHGKDISAGALLTQRQLARYLVQERQAHDHFTVKGNQSGLLEDITLYFQTRKAPEFVTVDFGHGRIETRKIWTTTALNDYLDFPPYGPSFPHRTRDLRQKDRQKLHRNRLRHHQSNARAGQRPA